jgi:flagellar motor switch/type III secretory pathway protein FliN
MSGPVEQQDQVSELSRNLALPAAAVESPTMLAARRVPFRVAITIPVLALKLRDLRSLQVGAVFTTAVSAAEDVPVRVGGASLGWAELDNVDGQMAVRLTRLV